MPRSTRDVGNLTIGERCPVTVCVSRREQTCGISVASLWHFSGKFPIALVKVKYDLVRLAEWGLWRSGEGMDHNAAILAARAEREVRGQLTLAVAEKIRAKELLFSPAAR